MLAPIITLLGANSSNRLTLNYRARRRSFDAKILTCLMPIWHSIGLYRGRRVLSSWHSLNEPALAANGSPFRASISGNFVLVITHSKIGGSSVILVKYRRHYLNLICRLLIAHLLIIRLLVGLLIFFDSLMVLNCVSRPIEIVVSASSLRAC